LKCCQQKHTKQKKKWLSFRLFLWRTHISTNAMWWQPNSSTVSAAHSIVMMI
jgi:hypothetical protein